MEYDPYLADIRFGTGLSPTVAPPSGTAEMLRRLRGPDLDARRVPVPLGEEGTALYERLKDHRRKLRDMRGTAGEQSAREAFRHVRRTATDETARMHRTRLARAVSAQDGLRERLTLFWANHFSVEPQRGFTEHLVSPYVEEAIRPHVTGRFSQMLRAASLHPRMLDYLDQKRSVGPQSRVGQLRSSGLNENLAREVIELHTLGSAAPYDQRDVREMAELLAGIGWNPERGLHVAQHKAQPGTEAVLGMEFGPDASVDVVHEALDALAAHPATARHLSAKLAAHFVADHPDPDLVGAMTDVWLARGGDLAAVVQTLLEHPAAWAPQKAKVRSPFEFVTASLRAMSVEPGRLLALGTGAVQRNFRKPLEIMGQDWEHPPSPQGWDDTVAAWVTPQFLAARIGWSMDAPARLKRDLPDPRELVVSAFGPHPPEEVLFAARAAETRDIGVGLIFASAAFQRR